MKISDDPIVSRDVSQRASEKDQLRKNQQKQIEDRLVQSPSHAFHQSVAASGDTYYLPFSATQRSNWRYD